ncbi:rhodanese-like domain-containing protein [Psychroserpens ponticola]|uniref:Rhodanese-like domain-containing protein n=1 Tax=Psychroserpens ponticola TaxID=2932268 RepID=A0ABY7S0F0_9FLAO|nr:rhodanese-like domain-containing protein [Psychroserpens ponticola]WCO02864.1 rhodanese-like domain-containing protein [Psychroserpens ponticola]
MRKIILVMSIFSSIFGMTAQQLDQIKVLEPSDYKIAIESKNVQLIDVRTSREYNSEHIKNALNIDVLNRKTFIAYFKELDPNEPVYLYCRSGSRSQRATKLLVELGFKEIYDLKGGILNY